MLRLPYFMLCDCCHCKMFCAVPLGTILFPVKDYICYNSWRESGRFGFLVIFGAEKCVGGRRKCYLCSK